MSDIVTVADQVRIHVEARIAARTEELHQYRTSPLGEQDERDPKEREAVKREHLAAIKELEAIRRVFEVTDPLKE